MTEHELYTLVAQYLQAQYPEVIYRFDLAADMKLTPGQASKHKTLHPNRGYPDLFVAEPRSNFCEDGFLYGGLFLELKREKAHLKKKNGEWASDHIAEQAEMLKKLRECGYKAEFAVGFDEAKRLMDSYLGDNYE